MGTLPLFLILWSTHTWIFITPWGPHCTPHPLAGRDPPFKPSHPWQGLKWRYSACQATRKASVWCHNRSRRGSLKSLLWKILLVPLRHRTPVPTWEEINIVQLWCSLVPRSRTKAALEHCPGLGQGNQEAKSPQRPMDTTWSCLCACSSPQALDTRKSQMTHEVPTYREDPPSLLLLTDCLCEP